MPIPKNGKNNAYLWNKLQSSHLYINWREGSGRRYQKAGSTPSEALEAKRRKEFEKEVSPNFLMRNWPPAFKEWSTKSVRDAFFASPQFPRLLNPEVVRETIARGIANGVFAYVGKSAAGGYEPFVFETTVTASSVELLEDMFIVTRETAEQYRKAREAAIPGDQPAPIATGSGGAGPLFGPTEPGPAGGTPEGGRTTPQDTGPASAAAKLTWKGEVPPQKWMNFYTKVLSKFAGGKDLKITLNVEVSPKGGISAQKIEETKVALRELGLDSDVETS